MNSLIIDRYTNQSPYRRYLGNLLTSIGWCFWVYLWSPLLALIGIRLGITYGNSAAGVRMVQELAATLANHLSMVSVLVGLFVAWALLQHFSKGNIRPAAQTDQGDPLRTSERAATIKVDKEHWRQSQRVVAFHDEQSGRIVDINTGLTPATDNSANCNIFIANILSQEKARYEVNEAVNW